MTPRRGLELRNVSFRPSKQTSRSWELTSRAHPWWWKQDSKCQDQDSVAQDQDREPTDQDMSMYIILRVVCCMYKKTIRTNNIALQQSNMQSNDYFFNICYSDFEKKPNFQAEKISAVNLHVKYCL